MLFDIRLSDRLNRKRQREIAQIASHLSPQPKACLVLTCPEWTPCGHHRLAASALGVPPPPPPAHPRRLSTGAGDCWRATFTHLFFQFGQRMCLRCACGGQCFSKPGNPMVVLDFGFFPSCFCFLLTIVLKHLPTVFFLFCFVLPFLCRCSVYLL